MAIYLKIPGIKGQTQTADFKDCLEVDTFHFGAGLGVTTGTSNSERTTGLPSFSEVSVSRTADSATPQLLQKLADAEVVKEKTVFTFVRKDNKTVLNLMTVTLSDVIISAVSLSSGGELPNETISLSYSGIEIEYTKQAEAGGSEGKAPFVYNISTDEAKAN